MFYVAGNKIYLTQKDKEKEIFPEVRIKNGILQVLDTGISKKPLNPDICTREEILARFGTDTHVEEKTSSDKRK